MPRFAKLAVATVAATLLLIAVGGFVRAMEAGLGCPDWPTCHGSLNPPSELAWGDLKLAWIEHSHRLIASVVVALVIALAVAARGRARPVRIAAWLLVPAVRSQALRGAIVVWLTLEAESVTLHLGGALVVLALGLYVVVRTLRPETVPVPARLAGLVRLTAAVAFGQMLLGSSVTGHHAGLAFTTFPSFDGHALPPLEAHLAPWLHAAHRFVAYLLAVLAVLVVVRARRTELAATAYLLAGLVAVQIGLGAANVWFELSAWSVVPHLAVGSWIWATLVVLGIRTSAQPAGATERIRWLGLAPA